MSIIEQYLAHYAEPLIRPLALEQYALPRFQYGLVIPAYNESPAFAKRLMEDGLWAHNILVIVVINQPADCPTITAQNQQLLAYFEQMNKTFSHKAFNLFRPSEAHSHFAVINACESLAPTKQQGVGQARKLGCDLAVALHRAGCIESPWLHSTDADATLPSDYFQIPPPNGSHAGIYGFRHQGQDETIQKATLRYEAAIRYYADSLRWAGSPYAAVALGSALACTFEGYCHVRGFPTRAGGEDFYLLNKLTKLAPPLTFAPVISLDARVSNRAPFGTGPAVAAIIEGDQAGEPYRYYDPRCFRMLKHWLDHLPNHWQNPDAVTELPAPLPDALQYVGLAALNKHLHRQCKTPSQALKASHQWFDAFKTLKLIHQLQTLRYPALPLEDCLNNAVYQESQTL